MLVVPENSEKTVSVWSIITLCNVRKGEIVHEVCHYGPIQIWHINQMGRINFRLTFRPNQSFMLLKNVQLNAVNPGDYFLRGPKSKWNTKRGHQQTQISSKNSNLWSCQEKKSELNCFNFLLFSSQTKENEKTVCPRKSFRICTNRCWDP